MDNDLIETLGWISENKWNTGIVMLSKRNRVHFSDFYFPAFLNNKCNSSYL